MLRLVITGLMLIPTLGLIWFTLEGVVLYFVEKSDAKEQAREDQIRRRLAIEAAATDQTSREPSPL